jgi:hypothetical protein
VSAVANIEPDEPLEGTVLDAEPLHVLKLGDEEFVCSDKGVSTTLLIRYADNPLLQMHHILLKAVPEDDHDRMWEAFEGLDDDEALEAVGNLVGSYSERPTTRPSRSSRGSKGTKRK